MLTRARAHALIALGGSSLLAHAPPRTPWPCSVDAPRAFSPIALQPVAARPPGKAQGCLRARRSADTSLLCGDPGWQTASRDLLGMQSVPLAALCFVPYLYRRGGATGGQLFQLTARKAKKEDLTSCYSSRESEHSSPAAGCWQDQTLPPRRARGKLSSAGKLPAAMGTARCPRCSKSRSSGWMLPLLPGTAVGVSALFVFGREMARGLGGR